MTRLEDNNLILFDHYRFFQEPLKFFLVGSDIRIKANDKRVKKEVGKTGPVKENKQPKAIGKTKTTTRMVGKLT